MAGGAVVVDHLSALGHRRIAMIEGDLATSTAAQRSKGFAARMAERGLTLPDRMIRPTDFTYAQGYRRP